MFGKFKIRYLLFFMVLSFGMMRNCYATRYWFNYDEKLFNSLCSSSDSLGCKVQCKDGNEFPAGPAIGVGCSNASDIKKFSYDTNFKKIEDLKTLLQGFKVGSNQSAYDYVKKTYCKNWKSSETICKELKKIEGNANVSTGKNGTTRQCVAKIVAIDNYKLLDSAKSLNVNILINTNTNGKNSMDLSSTAANTNDFVMSSKDTATVYQTNTFYFYSKGSNFSKFQNKYIAKAGNNKCPTITFCLDDIKKKDWYAELDGKCDPSKYASGVSQSSDGDGDNNFTLRDTEPNPGSNLISNNVINILDCKSLLGGDNVDNSLFELLHTIVLAVKIIVPIMLLALGSLDFAQAVFASNEDGVKKAQSKFIKRLVIAVVIFLIPSFLGVILRIANSIWGNIDPTFCGIL